MAALLLRPHKSHEEKPVGIIATLTAPLDWFFAGFNRVFDALSGGYAGLTKRLVRLGALVMIVYAGLLGLT
ncbi:hypothetical protein ABTM70_20085, partial [Acinetobacter baumannii]